MQGLSHIFWKTGIMTESTSCIIVRIKWSDRYKALCPRSLPNIYTIHFNWCHYFTQVYKYFELHSETIFSFPLLWAYSICSSCTSSSSFLQHDLNWANAKVPEPTPFQHESEQWDFPNLCSEEKLRTGDWCIITHCFVKMGKVNTGLLNVKH